MKTNSLVAAGIAMGSLLDFEPPAFAAEADFDQMAEEFSATRQDLARELSRELYLPLFPGTDHFFEAATNGPWESVSDAFAALHPHTDGRGFAVPVSRNELWAPIHETMSAWKEWARWQEDPQLLSNFYKPVLASLPEDSICFGGYALMVAGSRSRASSRYFITQNRLADPGYVAYLRALYGDRIWLPSQEDFLAAERQLADEVMQRKSKRKTTANPEGSVFLPGNATTNEIHGRLTGAIARLIFEKNKATHPFFVEESQAIDWMYPYLEPHGQILKLNPHPLEALAREAIDRNTQFWARQEEDLMAVPGFRDNVYARKSFAKRRTAIAGLYAHRKQYAHAEAAYRQAIRLCPASSVASARLAKMFEHQGRTVEAIQVMEAYLAADSCCFADDARSYLEALRQKAAQNLAGDDGREPQLVLELREP